MAKKAVAVTDIKGSDVYIHAGDEIDPSKFSKGELKELHANGAIKIEDTKDQEGSSSDEESGPDTAVESSDEQNLDPTKENTPKTSLGTTPAKATPAAAPAKTPSSEAKK